MSTATPLVPVRTDELKIGLPVPYALYTRDGTLVAPQGFVIDGEAALRRLLDVKPFRQSSGVQAEDGAGAFMARADGDGRAPELARILRSVVEARRSRYLMLNAPEDALDAICELVPGSRAPSVVPLSEPGMVAVHALVPAADVWSLLPRLEAAGGSSILLLPVERMLA